MPVDKEPTFLPPHEHFESQKVAGQIRPIVEKLLSENKYCKDGPDNSRIGFFSPHIGELFVSRSIQRNSKTDTGLLREFESTNYELHGTHTLTYTTIRRERIQGNDFYDLGSTTTPTKEADAQELMKLKHEMTGSTS